VGFTLISQTVFVTGMSSDNYSMTVPISCGGV